MIYEIFFAFLLLVGFLVITFELKKSDFLALWILIIIVVVGFQVFSKFNFLSLNLFFFDYWKLPLFLIMIISFVILIWVTKDYKFEVLILNTLVLIGSLIILNSDNLLILYLGLELQTFSIFILISKDKIFIKGAEAGLKYFILGALSSGLFLLGVTFLFSNCISINIRDLPIDVGFTLESINIGFILIMMALLFKLAVFPLHFWVPDIYEGSSWDVVYLISTLPKISLIVIFFQIVRFSDFLVFCSLLSIAIGAIGAINQTKMKRLLAYSGITHMGFILLSLSLINSKGYESGVIYLFIYIIGLIGVFMAIYSSFIGRTYYIIELGGMAVTNKALSVGWGVLFLSLAGIPPLSGFLSKWMVILSIIDCKFFISSFVIIIFSAIAAGYYLRIVKIIFFQKKSNYLNWVFILKPKYDLVLMKDYFLGFIVYFSLLLMVNPNLIILSCYSNITNLF